MKKDTRKRIINPATGRRVLMTGTIGKKLRDAKSVKRKSAKGSKKVCDFVKTSVKKTSDLNKARKSWIASLEPGFTKLMSGINFVLCIDTTHTAPQQGMLMNRFEKPKSKIKNIAHSEIERYDKKKQEMVRLTDEELSLPAFKGKTITLKSVWVNDKQKVVNEPKRTYENTKGFFSIKEMVKIVVQFEKLDRPKTKWFGGIDCHHVFFEGFRKNKDNKTYGIHWGS